MSVGDVDGDGQYEYVVKWDPSNSKDVSQVGYTGTGLHRHLPARRHPAAPHRPRRQHPRRRALHPVPGLRLRRRRPRGDDVQDRAGHEDHPVRRRRQRGLRAVHHDAARRTCGPGSRTPTTTGSAPPATTSTWSRCSAAGTSTPRSSPGTGPRRWSRRSASRRRYTYPLSRRGRRGAGRLLHRRLRARAAAPATCCALFEGFIVDGPGVPDRVRGRAPAGSCRPIRYKPGRARRRAACGATTRWPASSRATGSTGSSPAWPTWTAGARRRSSPAATTPAPRWSPTDWDGRRLQRALVRRQRLGADDQPVQRRPARPGRHRPRVRDHHHAGRPLAERGRRGRRRQAGDHLRRGHHRRRRQPALQLVRRAAAGAAPTPGSTVAARPRRRDARRPTSTRTAPAWRSTWCTRAARSRPYGYAMRDAAHRRGAVRRLHRTRHRARHGRRRPARTCRGLEAWALPPGGSDSVGPVLGRRRLLAPATPGHQPEHPLGGRHDHPDRQRRRCDGRDADASTTGCAARC